MQRNYIFGVVITLFNACIDCTKVNGEELTINQSPTVQNSIVTGNDKNKYCISCTGFGGRIVRNKL